VRQEASGSVSLRPVGDQIRSMVDLDCEGTRSRLAEECSQTVRSATCLARTFATGRARRLEGYRLLFRKSRLLAADLLNCLRPVDNLRCCCSLFDVDLSAAHLLDRVPPGSAGSNALLPKRVDRYGCNRPMSDRHLGASER